MLILVQKGEKQGGFFLKRRAKRGKLPPTLVGLQVGGYPGVLLKLYGEVTAGNRYLAPYLERGDVVIPGTALEKLGFHIPYLEELTRRQCVNTAKEWVKGQNKGWTTLLIDPLANCMGVAAEFCALGKGVWVVTPTPEAYGPCVTYTALTYGNPPVVTATLPKKGDLAVAPYGVDSMEIPQGIPVVSPGRIWAQKEDLSLPPAIGNTTPSGFDPLWVTAGCLAMFGLAMEEKATLRLPRFK